MEDISQIDIAPKAKSNRIVNEKYLVDGEVRIWSGERWYCHHKKRKNECNECGGSELCDHGKLKRKCKECDGRFSTLCEHKKQKHYCKECGGSV